MKKYLLAAMVLLIGMTSAATANEEEFSEVEYYRKLAEKQLAEAQAKVEPEPAPAPAPAADAVTVVTLPPPMPELSEPVYQYKEVYQYVECLEEQEPPKNVLAVIPQYFHSRNKDADFEVGGQKLKMAKSKANGAGVTLVYNRRFSDLFSVAFMYEYGFMNVKGGAAHPADVDVDAREDSRWHSHVVGILPEFNFGEYGKLQLSLIQGFDRASGTEAMGADVRDIDSYGTDVTSLMAWYEKDFTVGEGFKLSPYAGWRSLYVKVKNQNVWEPGGTKANSNLWVHLASAGMKVSFQRGPLGFSLRGGVNHRTTRDDIPGYGNRAVAPGVVQFSHRANLDRTVGSFGAGVNFAIKKRAFVGLNYDGFYGKHTSAHTGTVSFALPF